MLKPENATVVKSDNVTTFVTPVLKNVPIDARTSLALFISFVSVIFITIASREILRRGADFWDIIRAEDWYPSLAILQFLLWTLVITFSFLAIYLIRIFGGVVEPPPAMPLNILSLMGISVIVPFVSGHISKIKYKTTYTLYGITSTAPIPRPSIATMLEENNKPTLTRFQMFGWTWIGIGLYLTILLSTISSFQQNMINAVPCHNLELKKSIIPGNLQCDKLKGLNQLILPDIDPTLVVLMGLSQGGYLGGKLVTSTDDISIYKIVPGTGKDNKPVISIFGSNFGQNKDTVWFDDKQIPTEDITWTDGRIDLKAPIHDFTDTASYKIRVARGSQLDEETVTYNFKDKSLELK